jgi:nucleoside-diphosphate-sugar epimerase
MCEDLALNNISKEVCLTIVRPSTVCGFSRRQRFDLVVNILTLGALTRSEITVDGGEQFRPNLHIKDMCRAYVHVLAQPDSKISRKIFNVGAENLSLTEIALKVQQITELIDPIEYQETKDLRSYRVDSSLIKNELGFLPEYKVEDAINDIVFALESDRFVNPLDNSLYYNIKKMKELKLG